MSFVYLIKLIFLSSSVSHALSLDALKVWRDIFYCLRRVIVFTKRYSFLQQCVSFY